MQLPVMPPVSPMLAKLSRQMPEGDGLVYEPKWDGFRCIVFRDGDRGGARQPQRAAPHPLLPRAGRVAARESARALRDRRRDRDRRRRAASTSTLCSQRIHPAALAVKLLAAETPASFVAFDLLALGDDDLARRALREQGAQRSNRALAGAKPPVYLTPDHVRPRRRPGLVRPLRGRRARRASSPSPSGSPIARASGSC